jgi:SAM-dependent methyltransferase
VDRQRIDFLRDYIVRHEAHMERFVRPMFDPAGKRILVIGSGWGTETFWSLKNGAAHVVGVDPEPRPTEPLREALAAAGAGLERRFVHHQGLLAGLADMEPFDAVLSNNVFEHVFDLAGTLAGCARFIHSPGGRIVIFTDPLFLSSAGSHLPVGPWEHLTQTQEALRARPETATNWEAYRRTLNGMTLTAFLEAVREAGLWIEHLGIVPDRNRAGFPTVAPRLPPGLKPMDLLLEGVACRLAFPHNI